MAPNEAERVQLYLPSIKCVKFDSSDGDLGNSEQPCVETSHNFNYSTTRTEGTYMHYCILKSTLRNKMHTATICAYTTDQGRGNETWT